MGETGGFGFFGVEQDDFGGVLQLLLVVCDLIGEIFCEMHQ